MTKTKKHLVIVESPTKTKSLSKYLGDEYIVTSSKGHIVDLPKSKLGIDTENNFKPDYEPIKGKSTIINELKKLKREADVVYLATDLDREGEAISWHVVSELGGLDRDGTLTTEGKKLYRRVTFDSITKETILTAFDHPRDLNYHLIDAYQARRVLDRLVGYKLSPLLWKKIQFGLSAGRVQSVALRLVVEREKERTAFKSEAFFRILAHFTHDGKTLTAELTQIDGKDIEEKLTLHLFAGNYSYSRTNLIDQTEVENLQTKLHATREFTVTSAKTKIVTKSPPPPFTTAVLQRTASNRLSMTPKQTMSTAQKLYEEGFITYHRTDSTHLNEQFVTATRSYIQNSFGEKYLAKGKRIFGTKQKNAQEAHEAIRPAHINDLDAIKQEISTHLGEKETKLFTLIANRAIASQMSSAEFESTSIQLTPTEKLDHHYLFAAGGSVLIFDGFLKLDGRDPIDTEIPKLHENDRLAYDSIETTSHQTQAPPRYSDASLIKAMEDHGIGRPSTYAPTIDTILGRHYIERENNAFVPTDTGNAVANLLADHFPKIVDLTFTAGMEDQLDEISNGKAKWQTVIKKFYDPFAIKLKENETNLNRKDYKILEETTEPCPQCGHNLIVKLGRYGRFYSCSDFPTCKYAKPCTETVGINCPNCKDGDIIVRRTKRSKIFYGCSNYPKCNWASWDDPRKVPPVPTDPQTKPAIKKRDRKSPRKAH